MPKQTILDCVIKFLTDENRIADYLALKQGPYFLAIQGVQGSGKTTLVSVFVYLVVRPQYRACTDWGRISRR